MPACRWPLAAGLRLPWYIHGAASEAVRSGLARPQVYSCGSGTELGPLCCRPLEPTCECMTCKSYSRSFLHNLVARGLPFASHLVSYHNVAYTQTLTRRMRAAIQHGSFPEFVRDFVRRHYPQVRWLLRSL